MTDAELIARLRDIATNMFQSGHWGNDLDTTKDAADRIEALVRERDKYRDAFNTNCLVLRGTEEHAERLEAALRSWTETIATVMPEDFKDWHQNNPDEWPLVTAKVIKSLREQLDLLEAALGGKP